MCETEVIEDVNVVSPTAVMEYTTSAANHTSKNANGNIITLTLKNNHLIVETEERAVRTRVVDVAPKISRMHRASRFLVWETDS